MGDVGQSGICWREVCEGLEYVLEEICPTGGGV